MNVSSWISQRMKLAPKGSRSSAAGVFIAVTGVTIALMIMEFTLCIVLGFKHEIRNKVSGLESQISLGPRYLDASGATDDTLRMSPMLREAVELSAPDAHMSLALRQPVMLKTDTDFSALILTAHDNAHDFDFERSLITEGVWPDYSQDSTDNHIVISATTARQLQVGPGSRLDATFFVNDRIKARRFTVAGIYSSDIDEYDSTIAFGKMRPLQKVAEVDTLTGTGIDINGLPLDSIASVTQRLCDVLLNDYYNGRTAYFYPIDNVLHKGAMYFNWLSLLDTNVLVIFILMLCVAGFTLVSSIFIIVLERVATVGILRTLGASKQMIRSIFRRMAMRMTLKGMLLGNILGLGLMWLQHHFGIIKLNPEMYYLRTVPVEFSFTGLLFINIGVAMAAWLVLTIPAYAASKVDPAKTVRYE